MFSDCTTYWEIWITSRNNILWVKWNVLSFALPHLPWVSNRASEWWTRSHNTLRDKYGSHSFLSLCIHRLNHISFILVWLFCLVSVSLFILPPLQPHPLPADITAAFLCTFSGFTECTLWSGVMQHRRNRQDSNNNKKKKKPKSETRLLHLIPVKVVCLSFSTFQKMGIMQTSTCKSENAHGNALNMRNMSGSCY